MRQATLALVLSMAPGAGLADRKARDACAGGLSPPARDIDNTAVARSLPPGQALIVVGAEVGDR